MSEAALAPIVISRAEVPESVIELVTQGGVYEPPVVATTSDAISLTGLKMRVHWGLLTLFLNEAAAKPWRDAFLWIQRYESDRLNSDAARP